MALSAHERQIMLMNLKVAMIPPEAPRWSVEDFFSAVQKIYAESGAAMSIGEAAPSEDEDLPNDGANLIRIADIRPGTDGTLTILLHHGDAAASDPAFMNMGSGKVRPAGKGDDDALAHAGHLVIAGSAGRPKTAPVRALLERVPSLGRLTTLRFLNAIVRRTCQDSGLSFVSPETGRAMKYHPRIDATQPLSANLKRDLTGGRLSRIELIKPADEGFDENDLIHPTTVRLTHIVDRKLSKALNLDIFGRLRRWGRDHGYEDIQLQFRKGTDNKQHSPRFSTEHADAEDTVYARLEPIGQFSGPMGQCPETIVDEIQSKMHALLLRQNLW